MGFEPTAFTQVEFTLLFIEFRGAAEFSCYAKRGKENPSLKEGKSKPGEGKIAVGTLIAERPPHRTVRAGFPHTAPTSGD